MVQFRFTESKFIALKPNLVILFVQGIVGYWHIEVKGGKVKVLVMT